MSLWNYSLVAFFVISTLVAPVLGDETALNRSIYVPVRFSPCEHLENTLLYRGDTLILELPGTHVFQFTYYPSLSRLEPEFERVRVEGIHDGEPFRSEVVVTPATVYIGSKKIDLDLEEQMTRLRRHIDSRHETVELSLKCSSSCRRSAGLKSAETSP